MLRVLLSLILVLLLNIVHLPYVYAYDNTEVQEFLDSREKIWPDWYLTYFKSSNIKKDLIYPNWFEGEWLVTSENVIDSSDKPLTYIANFYKNDLGEIVGNRSENAESIGKSIFGDRLRQVKNDPISFNNQITYLSDNEYIESRITQRNQIFDNNLFFADEFAIQTVHKPEASRINQVEVMSKFYKCNKVNLNYKDINNKDICGFQYLATYGSKVGNTNTRSISQSKYKLTFKYLGK